MRNTKALCQTAVVAALYVALTTLNPLSWGVVQFRVANMLCALPFKDKRYAPAVLLGIAIANATSPFGPVDVLFGLLAEGTAYALVVWGPWKRLGILWKAVILSLSVALFIGVELSMMVGAPFWLTSTGLFVGTFLAVELGNLMISKTALAKVVREGRGAGSAKGRRFFFGTTQQPGQIPGQKMKKDSGGDVDGNAR